MLRTLSTIALMSVMLGVSADRLDTLIIPRSVPVDVTLPSPKSAVVACSFCQVSTFGDMAFHRFTTSGPEGNWSCEGVDWAPGQCHTSYIQGNCNINYHEACGIDQDLVASAAATASGDAGDVLAALVDPRTGFDEKRGALVLLDCTGAVGALFRLDPEVATNVQRYLSDRAHRGVLSK